MEHALPRTWSLCMTSENHGTVGKAGDPFSHAPGKHERVLVVEVPAGTRAPVAEFKGYVDGEPAVTWLERENMPRVGTKLFAGTAPASTVLTDERIEQVWNELSLTGAYTMAEARALFARAIAREVAAQAGQVAVPEDLARDAARYRWLVDADMLDQPSVDMSDAFSRLTGSALDAAIDKAMGKSK